MTCGTGIRKSCQDSTTTGTRYEMMRMMYCATCVQVTERIPPSTEQKRTPMRPTKTPMRKSRPMKRDTMRPTPVTCAMR